jgi:hypothetical protein
MAALAVGTHFGVSLEDAVKAVEDYVPSNNRSQLTKTEKNTLIVDAYNANPSSMTVALNNLAAVVADKKVALLGDMLELGSDSAALHLEHGRQGHPAHPARGNCTGGCSRPFDQRKVEGLYKSKTSVESTRLRLEAIADAQKENKNKG